MWTLFVNELAQISSLQRQTTLIGTIYFQIDNHHYLIGCDQWSPYQPHTLPSPLLVQNTWRYLTVHLFCLLGKVVKTSLRHIGQALVTICEACYTSSFYKCMTTTYAQVWFSTRVVTNFTYWLVSWDIHNHKWSHIRPCYCWAWLYDQTTCRHKIMWIQQNTSELINSTYRYLYYCYN